MSEDKTRINIKIDSKLKEDLKLVALKNKETMTDIVVRCIEEYLEENKDKIE